MQKTINKILLLIIILLTGLLSYKSLKPVSTVLTPTQTTTIQSKVEIPHGKIGLMVKEYLLNNPEVVLEAIELLRQRKIQDMQLNVFKIDKWYTIANTTNVQVVAIVNNKTNYCFSCLVF